MTTPYVKDFQIEGNQITKISPFNNNYSQIVINEPIPKTGVFTFKIKILKSSNEVWTNSNSCSAIFIGIIPPEFKKQRVSHFSHQAFTFFGKKAKSYPN